MESARNASHGAHTDQFENHCIHFKQDGAWRSVHDAIQQALAYEFRRLTISLVDNDAQLRHNYYHLTSQRRGDMAVNDLPTDLQVLSNGDVPGSQSLIDVYINSMVNGQGE